MNDFLKERLFKGDKLKGITTFMVFAILLLIMVPVPTIVLDILLLINIAVSALIFLMSLQAKNVLEFSVLPTMLIFTTLSRIVLNVSSSRLILGKADGGKVIDAIGNITIGGDYVVGIIVFIIITIVMFLVINSGTDRVAGVSARFVLDSLPGKQMAIDSDLNNGLIDMATAQKRRQDLEKESDFYKSMDGATKFVKGDAIAGLIITFVNVIGGLIMGMTRHNMSLSDAASKYTILSIGDGLVNQLPSLLIASAAAFMVTRGNSKSGIGKDIFVQFVRYKEPLRIISIILGVIGLLSLIGVLEGIPWIACFILAWICYAMTLIDANSFIEDEENTKELQENIDVVEQVEENILYVDKISIHVGTNVINSIVEKDITTNKASLSSNFSYRVQVLKDTIKDKYGIKIPEVRIKDDINIASNKFLIKIANTPSVALEVKPNCIFAMTLSSKSEIDFGEEAEIKELGFKGFWISKDKSSEVEAFGAITYSVSELIILYLEKIVEDNLDKLISREDIKEFKEEVSRYNSAIVSEISEMQIQNSLIQKVIQSLLCEKIPIKNMEFILECIADATMLGYNKSVDSTTQYIREQISSSLTEDKVENGILNIVTFSNETRSVLYKRFKGDITEENEIKFRDACIQIGTTHSLYNNMNQKFVFLIDKEIRRYVFNLIWDMGIKIDIISFEELPKLVKLEQLKQL